MSYILSPSEYRSAGPAECSKASAVFRAREQETGSLLEFATGSRLPKFGQLDVAIADSICWAFMRPDGRPCFTPSLLAEIHGFLPAIRAEHKRCERIQESLFKYFVLGSRTPRTFSLGGDLRMFERSIKSADRETLRDYAHRCVDVVYEAANSFGLPVITIALVQGDALGGGFEAALACNVIIAEKSAKFGLPEVLFNLFPGMGAYNLLSRRLDTARAEQIILSGRIYSADDMHAMGIVDLVVEDGLGEEAVHEYVNRNLRRHNAERAIYWTRQRVNPVRRSDLRAIVELWVDTALSLSEFDLRKMARIAAAQDRRRTIGTAFAVAAE